VRVRVCKYKYFVLKVLKVQVQVPEIQSTYTVSHKKLDTKSVSHGHNSV